MLEEVETGLQGRSPLGCSATTLREIVEDKQGNLLKQP